MSSARGALTRSLSWLRGRRGLRTTPAVTIDTPGLELVVAAFDETEAASAALARSPAWNADRPAVLRHHLVVPAARHEDARALLESDGWHVRSGDVHEHPPPAGPARGPADGVALTALRVQRLDALHCAQASSRMAGLAQRLDGDSLGWDALQPPRSGMDRSSGHPEQA